LLFHAVERRTDSGHQRLVRLQSYRGMPSKNTPRSRLIGGKTPKGEFSCRTCPCHATTVRRSIVQALHERSECKEARVRKQGSSFTSTGFWRGCRRASAKSRLTAALYSLSHISYAMDRRMAQARSKRLARPENLDILFMYQELLGRGYSAWQRARKR